MIPTCKYCNDTGDIRYRKIDRPMYTWVPWEQKPCDHCGRYEWKQKFFGSLRKLGFEPHTLKFSKIENFYQRFADNPRAGAEELVKEKMIINS